MTEINTTLAMLIACSRFQYASTLFKTFLELLASTPFLTGSEEGESVQHRLFKSGIPPLFLDQSSPVIMFVPVLSG